MTKEALPADNNGQRSSFLSHPFEALHDDVNRLFDRYLPSRITHLFSDEEKINHFARMDVSETDKAIDIKLDVPGVEIDDIEIMLNDHILSIKGKRETSSEEEKEDFRRVERSCGSFIRRLELPDEINETKINAAVEKGVLNIHILKSAKAKAKERKIKIKAS